MRSSPTVEYAFATRTTALTATTRHDFSSITLSIPETQSRTFRSVYVEIHCRGTETSGTSLTSWLIGIKLGATAFSDTTVAQTLTHSGDQQSHRFLSGDLSSYFNSNFGSGTTQTCEVGVAFGGLGVINVTAKLYIQYEYDETHASADTRVKTVRIPIESGTTTLTNSLAEVGTWQVPALLPNWQMVTAVSSALDTITIVGHGLSDGMAVVFKSSGAVPAPLVAGTTYYMRDDTAGTFKVAATRGGSAIDLTTTGSGTIEMSADFLLPEDSATTKDTFFEVFCNEGHVSGTTDDQLELQLDSATADAFGSLEEALDSSPWMYVIWKPSVTETIAHAFNARGTTTGRLPQLGAVMVVTYTYDESSTTTVLNSVEVPLDGSIGAMHGSTSTDLQRHRTVYPIQEPTTIALRQSGVVMSWNHSLQNPLQGLNVRVGSQAFRTYTPANVTGSPAGQHTLVQRIDADAAQGAALTLDRGDNALVLDVYRTSTAAQSAGYGVSARVLLNYRSGKASTGSYDHARTIRALAHATSQVGALNVGDTAAFAPTITESEYWVSSFGYELSLTHASIRGAVVVSAEVLSGEQKADGWVDVYSLFLGGTNELAVYTAWWDASKLYDRHPTEPQDRLAVEGSRKHRFSSPIDNASAHSGWAGLVEVITIHTLTHSVSRTSSGLSSPDTTPVKIHRADNDDLLYATTLDSSGDYEFTSYDDANQVYAHAEAEGKGARSVVFTAA